MKRAAASEGPDRQRLIELALAWHQLARDRRDDERRLILRGVKIYPDANFAFRFVLGERSGVGS